LDNLGPLSRREHRFKTFGRITVRQPVPGTFVWRTRFGRVIITNPAGTHDLGTGAFADALWQLVNTAPRGWSCHGDEVQPDRALSLSKGA
jgi:hypothetical protein